MEIPTSAVTSPQYRRVMEATLRRGAEYLSLLPIETWLEPAKGFSRLPVMPMIRTSSNPIANVLRNPPRFPIPILCSVLCNARTFLPHFHTSTLDHKIYCKERDGEGRWVSERSDTEGDSGNIIRILIF